MIHVLSSRPIVTTLLGGFVIATLLLVPVLSTASVQPHVQETGSEDEASRPADVAKRLEEARRHLQSGDLAAARDVLQEIRETDSDNAEILTTLGMVQRDLGETQAAIRVLQEAAEIAPERPDTRFQLAVTLAESGDPHGAISHLQEAEELAPEAAVIPAYLGVILRRIGRDAGAARAFERARKRDPDAWGLDMDAALAWQAADEPERALSAVEEAVSKEPDDSRPYRLLGDLLVQRSDPESWIRAPAALREAIERGQDDVETYWQLALAYTKLRMYMDAEEAYREAIEKAPNRPELYINLGQSLVRQRRLNEALENFNKALELDDTRGWAHHMKATTLWNLHRLESKEEAMAAYERAMELMPERAEPRVGAARMLIADQDYEAAESHLRDAMGLPGGGHEVWWQFGRLRHIQGDSEEAIEMLRTALEEAPPGEDRQGIRHLLGQAMVKAGRAEEWQEELAASDGDRGAGATGDASAPATPQAGEHRVERLEKFVRVYMNEGRPEAAIPRLQEARKDFPDEPGILRLLVEVYEAAGDTEAAEEARRDLRELEDGGTASGSAESGS